MILELLNQVETFDIFYKANDNEYQIGSVYPDEDNLETNPQPVKLWSPHHKWDSSEEGYQKFIDDVNRAYIWDNLKKKNAIKEFFIYNNRKFNDETIKNIHLFNSLSDLMNNLPVGEFGVIIY